MILSRFSFPCSPFALCTVFGERGLPCPVTLLGSSISPCPVLGGGGGPPGAWSCKVDVDMPEGAKGRGGSIKKKRTVSESPLTRTQALTAAYWMSVAWSNKCGLQEFSKKSAAKPVVQDVEREYPGTKSGRSEGVGNTWSFKVYFGHKLVIGQNPEFRRVPLNPTV